MCPANLNMKKIPFPITRTNFEENVGKWLEIIASGESGSIIFFPRTDRLRRLPQCIGDQDLLKKYLKKSHTYHFLTLDLELFHIEELEDLEEFIVKQINSLPLKKYFRTLPSWDEYLTNNNLHIILLVPIAEKLLEISYYSVFVILDNLIRKYSSIQVLLFFEKDILHPQYLKTFSIRTTFLQNIVYYPLYSEKDTSNFIYYLLCKWNLRISQKLTLRIIEQCGGHLWLVKEAVRYFRQNKGEKHIFDRDEMRLRLEDIYNCLLESEKSLLRKIIFGQTDYTSLEKHSMSHLRRIHFLSKDNSFTIKLLENYIGSLEEKRPNIEYKNGSVFLNEVPIQAQFSRKELKVLKGLLQNENKILSRDEVAKYIWPINTQENYSDWAIDQLINRLRKRLAKLSISKEALKTLRGKGYVFSFKKIYDS